MFFSVKTPVKIMGKVYTPCICYPLPDILAPTIDKLVEEEKAYKFDERVYFQNGKIIEKKTVVKEAISTEKPRKDKKNKEISAKQFVKDTKDVILPSLEENTDNEDF